MADQIKALDALIESVEAGTAPDELAIAMPDQMTTNSVYAAYRGSVDAALALKETLLPEWRWELFDHDGCRVWSGQVLVSGEADTPARALLIATLKAYRHELEGRG